MKRSGFTLVELIFAIVIIGVLAAVAVPKFKNLKQNAQAANIVKYYNDISDTAKLQYMNLTEAGGVASTAINLSDLYDFKGKEWSNKIGDFNTSSYVTKVGGFDQNFTVAYTDGNVTMTMTVATSTPATEKKSFKTALEKVMDFASGSDTNTTVLNLNAQ
jgi:prepilin-type N-terminal cleavage/methylation domain-containing protein